MTMKASTVQIEGRRPAPIVFEERFAIQDRSAIQDPCSDPCSNAVLCLMPVSRMAEPGTD